MGSVERKKQYMNTRQIVALCLMVLALSSTGWMWLIVQANPVSPNVYLNDLPSQATYTVKTDGVNYWAVRYDGYVEFESTNASYVFQSVLGDNRLISVKAGKYYINYDVKSTYENFTIQGANMRATEIIFGGTGGFTLSTSISKSFRIGVKFYDMALNGQNRNNAYGIRSRSYDTSGSHNLVLQSPEFMRIKFTGWNGTNSHALDLVGAEEAKIQYNEFTGSTSSSFIYLWEDGSYESGNFYISYNYMGFVGSATNWLNSAVYVNNTGVDYDSGVGGIYFINNVVLGDKTPYGTAVIIDNRLSRELSGHHRIQGNRLEMCDLWMDINGTSHQVGGGWFGNWSVKYSDISGNTLTSNCGTTINLGNQTTLVDVHDNVISQFNVTSPSYFVKDYGASSSTTWNNIYNNYFYGTADFKIKGYTHFYGNSGKNPLGNQTNFRLGTSSFSYFGQWGDWGNNTLYRVQTTDVMLTVSGGSGVNVTVYDGAGTFLVSYASASGLPKFVAVSWRYQIKIVYASKPNLYLSWT